MSLSFFTGRVAIPVRVQVELRVVRKHVRSPYDLYGGMPPHEKTPTSTAAAREIEPYAQTQRELVLLGELVATTEARRTRTGRYAVVYVIARHAPVRIAQAALF